MSLKEVYIVNRCLVHTNTDDNTNEEIYNCEVIRACRTEEQAIEFIRREITEWRDFLVEQGLAAAPIVDETQFSSPGTSAYFRTRFGNIESLRKMYYVKGTVE